MSAVAGPVWQPTFHLGCPRAFLPTGAHVVLATSTLLECGVPPVYPQIYWAPCAHLRMLSSRAYPLPACSLGFDG